MRQTNTKQYKVKIQTQIKCNRLSLGGVQGDYANNRIKLCVCM